MKRVVVISDTQCGHYTGLTPSEWQANSHHKTQRIRRFAHIEQLMWRWYQDRIDEYKPVDILLVNGDAIEGKECRSGGTELLDSDRTAQVDMAADCITPWEAKTILMTYGTPYHTGHWEDWEDEVAQRVGATIKSVLDFEVDGIVFNARHFVSRSIIPHGRFTALSRAAMWNALISARENTPQADIIIRSHAHYYAHCDDPYSDAFITPALQLDTKYGKRHCEGDVHVGLLKFDIDEGGVSWQKRILNIQPKVREMLKL